MIEEHTQSEDSPKRAEKPSIDEVISALNEHEGATVPTSLYYGLSDLDTAGMRLLEPHWNKLDPAYKRKILAELTDASEINLDFDYQTLGTINLDDSDATVRATAIDLLWADESLSLLPRLVDMAESDDSTEVRAAAASALGRFILLGEYGEIPEKEVVHAQEVAIGLLNDTSEHIDIRRRALEALSNSSLDFVSEAIQDAYDSDEHLMQVSSIFAMGRSYEDHWNEIVLREIRNDDPEIRYEAARAAGELEIEEAIPLLGQLAVIDEREIRQVAIWSLGEIGGSQAMRLLTAMAEDAEEAKDEDLLEAIEDAMGYAGLSGADLNFDGEDDF